MGASATDLIGLGIPAEPARRLGETIATIAGVGTAQTGGAASGSATVVLLTTSSGQTALVLNGNMGIGRSVEVYNTTATAGLVFPPSGGSIDGGSTDASVSIAQNRGRIFRKVSATSWRSIYGS